MQLQQKNRLIIPFDEIEGRKRHEKTSSQLIGRVSACTSSSEDILRSEKFILKELITCG